MDLHIDIETYSSVDLKSSGVYKYVESLDFEIILIAWAINNGPIEIIDLLQGDSIPEDFIDYLTNYHVKKHAHNAAFERQAFKAIGYDIPIDEWECSMVKAAYCGWPLSLNMVSKAMKLEEYGKLATGRALIKYFCQPCKPSKANNQRERNFPENDPDRWQEFKEYCIQDVVAERAIHNRLQDYSLPQFEVDNYRLDQEINDRGICIDPVLVENALKIDNKYSKKVVSRLKELTGLDNPNSVAQLKSWLGETLGEEIKSLAKEFIDDLLEKAVSGTVKEVLNLRAKASKTSIKKYIAMQNCICDNGRAHGLFQFYGANRTGRWAGRLIQLQNLPQNHLEDIEFDRFAVRSGDYDLIEVLYDNISSLLSQLIRTAFIAKPGHTFAVIDFNAIEARVIAWLANEKWRMNVFNSHGKIYEASASKMFSVPIEQITKGSDLRYKGKVAELALGYQGSVGALKAMGGEQMGLSETEMKGIVKRWRDANPSIVNLWFEVENCAKRAIRIKRTVTTKHLSFNCNSEAFRILLPSGRELFYLSPTFTNNRFHQESIKYKGLDQVTKQWWWVETYGGKLVENIVQAIARDLLADSIYKLNKAGVDIVMHVHDEVVCEIKNPNKLKELCDIMSSEVSWAKGLPLAVEGYVTPFYKKD